MTDTGNSNRITREYLDSLLIETRYMDSAVPDTGFELYGKKFASPIMTAALSHLDHFMFPGAADALAKGAEDITPVPVNGVDMIAFRYPAQDDGWKAVGYMTRDGDATQMILFWYGTPEAAGRTKTIMESIGETETV